MSAVGVTRPPSALSPAHPRLSDRNVALLILAASLPSVMHSRWIALPLLPLTVAVLVAWDRRPWVWIGCGGACLAMALWRWHDYEDHVFFGIYQLLAVGIALTRTDFRASVFLQLRWLTGSLFGVAVAWKLASASYRRGDLFRTVALVDGRFDPLTEVLGPLNPNTLAVNRQAAEHLASTTPPAAVPLLESGGFTTIAVVLGMWTIAIEMLIATSFLAPDSSRLSRFRHPSLLTFGLTTYVLVPVIGFSVMLAGVGLADRTVRPAFQWLYLLVIFAAVVRGVILL